MKLCKDCKHSVWPHPLAALYGTTTYLVPMCGHPDARRSLVNGDLLDTCAGAREEANYMPLAEPGCGRDATRFEERPRAPKEEPILMGSYAAIDVERPAERSLWTRIFGG